MHDDEAKGLSDLYRLALMYIAPELRPAARTALAFDERLGAIRGKVTEPLMAQMRFAWWRDRLQEPLDARPKGDEVLDAIGKTWSGREEALVSLVDGWEATFAEPPTTEEVYREYAEGRAALFAGLASMAGDDEEAARSCGRAYALGDALAQASSAKDRDTVLRAFDGIGSSRRLGRDLRGLTVLGGLGARMLRNGQGPLFGDRSSALYALRLGIFGR